MIQFTVFACVLLYNLYQLERIGSVHFHVTDFHVFYAVFCVSNGGFRVYGAFPTAESHGTVRNWRQRRIPTVLQYAIGVKTQEHKRIILSFIPCIVYLA